MSNSDDQFNSGMRNRLNRFDKTNNSSPITRQEGSPPKRNFQKILEDQTEIFEGVEGDIQGTGISPKGGSPLFDLIDINPSKGTLGNSDFPNETEALTALANVAKHAGSSSSKQIDMASAAVQMAPQPTPMVKTDSIFGMSAITQDSKKMPRTDQGMMSLMGVSNTKVEKIDLDSTTSSVADAPPSYAKLKVSDNPDMNLNAGLQGAIVANNAANMANSVQNIQNTTPQHAAPVTRIQELKNIIDQIVEALTVVSQQGKTETTVTLKGIPLFTGATIRLTTYDTAPGQFNVTFGGLKPEALLLIQQKQVDGTLQESLAQKGYMVHILVATSQKDDVPIATAQQEQSRFTRDQEQSRGQQQQRQQQQQDEDSTG